MTVTTPAAPVAVASAARVRPVWRAYGGGGLLVGGLVLLFATVVELGYFAGGAADPALLFTYGISFVAALTLLAGATLPLALGATGADGVVGASTLGRIALITYGWAFLAAQVALLFSQYALPEVEAGGARAVNLALTVLQGVAAIVAAVVIFRARIATGIARWSLVLSVVLGIAAGSVANASPSLEVMMGAFCLSALSIVFVGVTYVGRRPVLRRSAADAESAPASGW